MGLRALDREIIECRKCPRLVAWRESVARTRRKAYRDWVYWGKPVPGFGDPRARIMVVGLAPGAHGSNRTGRMFTGDASGQFLYAALHRAGFANQPVSTDRNDGLQLHDIYVTASVRCVPPDNKPTPEELANCQPFLHRELIIIQPKVIVCLGRIAFDRLLRIFSVRPVSLHFAHGAIHQLPAGPLRHGPWLICSYHPSQQNTLTGRLTTRMFDKVWAQAGQLAEHD